MGMALDWSARFVRRLLGRYLGRRFDYPEQDYKLLEMTKDSETLELGSPPGHTYDTDADDAKEQDVKLTAGIVDVTLSVTENGHEHTADEDNPFFIRILQYTKEEEARVIRILDTRLFPWILLTTFVLNMDRTNNSNAISDNLPADLGFNTNVVNTATAMYSGIFTVFCFTGAVIAKIVGPSKCKSSDSFCVFGYAFTVHDIRDTHSYVRLGASDRSSRIDN